MLEYLDASRKETCLFYTPLTNLLYNLQSEFLKEIGKEGIK